VSVASLTNFSPNNAFISLSLLALFFAGITYIEVNGTFYFIFYLCAITCLFFFRIKRVLFPSYCIITVLMITAFILNYAASSILTLVAHVGFISMSYIIASSRGSLEALLITIFRLHISFIIIISFLSILNPLLVSQIIPFAVVHDEGVNRINGFATEPSYAGFLLAFIWFMLFRKDRVSMVWTCLAIASMLLLKSIFGFLLVGIIIMHLSGEKRVSLSYRFYILVAACLIIIFQIGDSYLSFKISSLFSNFTDLGNGPGAVRMSPYLYLNEIGWFNSLSLFGNGSGVFGSRYFDEYAFAITEGTALSGHMAEFLYDYGVVLFLGLFVFCCVYFPAPLFVSIPLTLLVFLNTGIGSYLFVTYFIAVLQGLRHDKEAV